MSEMSPIKAARIAEADREKKARKKYTITVSVICAVLVVLVIFVALFSSNLFYNTTTAVDIGGYKFTVADFNFNYMSAYNSYYNSIYNMYSYYGDLVSAMLPDLSKPLSEQAYPGADDGTTWADYFEDAALQRMQNVAMLCDQAEKAGITADEDELANVEATISSVRTQAQSNGFPDLNSYLARMYGKGMTEKVYRRNLEREALASTYSSHVQDGMTYTQEQKDAYYAEHKDEYDVIIYRTYFFSGTAVEDDEETEENEALTAEEAMAKAESNANELKSKATSEQAYIDAVAEFNADVEDYDADASTLSKVMGSNLNTVVSEWLLNADRKAGDVEVIKTPDDSSASGYYVLYFKERDNNQFHAVSFYYGLVEPNEENVSRDTFDTDEEYEEALKQLTELNASTVLNEYENGTDKTLEGFQKVMDDNADMLAESGPLNRVGIYDVPDEVSEWLHDSARVAGDTTRVYVPDYGCFILYFVSDDGVYADLVADTNLRDDDYHEWADETVASYPIDTEWEMVLTKKLPSLGG